MVAKQEIRIRTAADGVRIAYATVGQGPPLVKAANYLTHLEHDWKGPVWRHWLHGLARHHMLVRYDERGCGLSDWHVTDFSIEAWVQDLEAVVEALGLERFPLLGISQGASVSVAYDAGIPFEEGRLLAALIPGARFVPLDSKNHILLAEEPAWSRFLAEMHAFLGLIDPEEDPTDPHQLFPELTGRELNVV